MRSQTLRVFHPVVIAFLAVLTAGGGTQLGKPFARPVRFKTGVVETRCDFSYIERLPTVGSWRGFQPTRETQ